MSGEKLSLEEKTGPLEYQSHFCEPSSVLINYFQPLVLTAVYTKYMHADFNRQPPPQPGSKWETANHVTCIKSEQ